MVTGYQRQHRKQINYIPCDGADTQTTDQYTRLMTHICNAEGIHEQFSRACEQAAVTGMVLLQPYLDYTKDDPAQGTLKVKLWEYNSFLVDPYARELDFSDSQYVWCQEYISKKVAEEIKLASKGVAEEVGKTTTSGTFSAAAIRGLSISGIDRVAKATEETAKNTGKIADRGQLTFT